MLGTASNDRMFSRFKMGTTANGATGGYSLQMFVVDIPGSQIIDEFTSE